MGKNYKRKTRWRTLNIADYPSTPAGEEDDEDGIRKSRENGTRKGQNTHKSVHIKADQKNEIANGNGKKDSTEGASPSRSQPKIIFDENEYTRITTPRQDVLFKKGYLAKKKVWSCNNASTSATPSTTESQSASHSTADGSETTEDPQLLDYRDNNVEEFQSHIEPTAQMSYGTFYDHTSGYYYEYPIMVVGPPIPGPPIHNVLATMPCEPVPLRPIEWINPAFVPKLEESHCLINYQNTPADQQFATTLDENGMPLVTNGDSNAASWTGSVTGEEQLNDEDQQLNEKNDEETKAEKKEEQEKEEEQEPQEQLDESVQSDVQNYSQEIVNSNYPNEHCLETVLAQQLHVSHHVIPSGPQTYMYPGHYMFGPTLINLNGMTIQSGPMIRTTEMTTPSVFARRKKKKKLNRRKTRRPNNTYNNEEYGQEEEEDYSSETDIINSQNSAATENNFTSKNSRPLNPNCKEFVLKNPSNLNNQSTLNKQLSSSSSSSLNLTPENDKDEPSSDNKLTSSSEIIQSKDACESPFQFPAINNIELATEASINEFDETNNEMIENNNETELGVDVTCAEFNEILERFEPINEKSILSNGNNENHNYSSDTPSIDTNEDKSNHPNHHEVQVKNSRKKYKNPKIIREPTPGPDLDEQTKSSPSKPQIESESDVKHDNEDQVLMGIDAIEAQLNGYTCNDDSGFESQTRLSDYPITEAVTEWLQRANSPELFKREVDSESDDEDPENRKPPKNLVGNPMLALSVNDQNISEFAKAKDITPKKSKRKTYVVKRKQLKKHSGSKRKNGTNKKTSNKQIISKNFSAGFCEFTDDSNAGMRVAECSRINSIEFEDNINDNFKGKSSLDLNDDKILNVSLSNVKTYERGEIVVSFDGVLLPKTVIGKLDSIEEPDILDCWDPEEFKSAVKLNDKQCNELDNDSKVNSANLDIVRKYYKLGRDRSISSIEGSICESIKSESPEDILKSKTINEKYSHHLTIDEGIEVYESCYNGKLPILFDKSDLFYHRKHDEGPIPCKAACCIVQ